MAVDFGKTASDYSKHRAGFPPALLVRLRAYGVGAPGQQVLDIGTGTGTLARQFAQAGCSTIGIDPKQQLLREAARLDAQAGVQVQYQTGVAEELPFPPGSFDVVAAGQAWHWFKGERAATEIMRVLKPGGSLVIAYFDWLPMGDNLVARTEQLIMKHNPAWNLAGGTGVHPECFPHVYRAGFKGVETFSFEVDVPYTHEAWLGRIRASAGVAASLTPDRVAAFDAEHRSMLDRDFPADPLTIPHRVWALTVRKPVAARTAGAGPLEG